MDAHPEGPSTDHLEQVIEQHREEIHRIPGVVETAVGCRTEQEAVALSDALQGAQGKRVADVLAVDVGGPEDRPNQDGPR